MEFSDPSDGPISESKNVKNFSNLANHLLVFGITAEWCDGFDAVAKKLARIESLRKNRLYFYC